MGFYVQIPIEYDQARKAEYLVIKKKAELLFNPPRAFQEIPEGKVLICVVKNGSFDAAGVAVNDHEFQRFKDTRGDPRPRVWLLMDRETVLEMHPELGGKV